MRQNRGIRIGWVAAVLLSVGSASGCEQEASPDAFAQAGESGRPSAVKFRGMAIQVADGRNVLATYGPLLREIADLGANTVLLGAAGYMEHARSQAVYIDARKTAPASEFVALIKLARELDLHVFVMPVVLLRHPRGSEWRGVIDPPDWKEWWREYRDFVEYFADVAREGGADAMLVGSELVSSEKYTDQWVRTIEAVRGRFAGKVGYSANWDHYKPVQFWDKLDFVSMTSYYTLADEKGATVEQIVERWQPVYRDITKWRAKIGKPLIFTEVGWCSQEGAATAPWNYYQNMKGTPAGHEEQRRLYEAFLQVWDGAPGVAGVIWWEWTPQPGGPSDFNYTPRNKPAEAVLHRWFRESTEPLSSRPADSP